MSDIIIELYSSQFQKALIISQMNIYALWNLELMSHYLNSVNLHPLIKLQYQFQRE